MQYACNFIQFATDSQGTKKEGGRHSQQLLQGVGGCVRQVRREGIRQLTVEQLAAWICIPPAGSFGDGGRVGLCGVADVLGSPEGKRGRHLYQWSVTGLDVR